MKTYMLPVLALVFAAGFAAGRFTSHMEQPTTTQAGSHKMHCVLTDGTRIDYVSCLDNGEQFVLFLEGGKNGKQMNVQKTAVSRFEPN